MIDTEVRRLHSDRDIDGLADLSADLRQEIQRLTAENEGLRKHLAHVLQCADTEYGCADCNEAAQLLKEKDDG